MNSEYWFTFYSTPPEDPVIVEYGFWYEDVYCYVDTYLVESHGELGGTLGVSIYPYVYRVVANRWNNNSQLQEFLYDQDYVGYFYDSFGGDVFVEPGDGAELDVYAFPSYTGDLGLTKMAPITTLKKKNNIAGSSRIFERQGLFDPAGVGENKQGSDVPKKRAGKIADNRRTRNQIRNRQHAQ